MAPALPLATGIVLASQAIQAMASKARIFASSFGGNQRFRGAGRLPNRAQADAREFRRASSRAQAIAVRSVAREKLHTFSMVIGSGRCARAPSQGKALADRWSRQARGRGVTGGN